VIREFVADQLANERAVFSFAVVWGIVIGLWILLDSLSDKNRGRFRPIRIRREQGWLLRTLDSTSTGAPGDEPVDTDEPDDEPDDDER